MDNNIKKNESLRTLKLGGYSIVLTVIVIVAAVLINLIVEALPEKYTNIDLTGSDIYAISEDSEKFIADLDTDVTIYYVTTNEGKNAQLDTFVKTYAQLSKHLKVVYVDPESDYAFVEQYELEDENSLVISSDKRSQAVPYDSIYQYSETVWNEYYSMYYYYGYQIEDIYSPDVFDADNQITSAIDYVTTDILPTVYMLAGHGESTLSANISALLEYNNIRTGEANLLSADNAVPEDASVIVINNPTSDLTAAEAETLTAFIDGGGKVILVTDVKNYDTESMKNLTAVAEHCGLTAYDGVVLEDNTGYYTMNKYFLLPELQSCALTVSITNPSAVNILMNRAHAIVRDEDYSGSMAITPVLVTSDTAYIIGADEEVRSRRDDDVTGEFYIGAMSRNSEDGLLVWYSASYINSDSSMNYVNYNNLYVFGYTITEICDKPVTITVDSTAINADSYLTMSETSINILTVIIQYLMPLAILVPSVVVWIMRRVR